MATVREQGSSWPLLMAIRVTTGWWDRARKPADMERAFKARREGLRSHMGEDMEDRKYEINEA